MSQRIVIFCDVHQSRDEDVPGKSYDLALRPNAEGFTFATVDLCDTCAKPLLDVFGELVEVGREFNGEPSEVLKTSKRGRPGKSKRCPICGDNFASRGSMRTHVSSVHGQSISKIEGSSDGLACPHCRREFAKPQGLTAHIRTTHPTEYAKAKARAGG